MSTVLSEINVGFGCPVFQFESDSANWLMQSELGVQALCKTPLQRGFLLEYNDLTLHDRILLFVKVEAVEDSNDKMISIVRFSDIRFNVFTSKQFYYRVDDNYQLVSVAAEHPTTKEMIIIENAEYNPMKKFVDDGFYDEDDDEDDVPYWVDPNAEEVKPTPVYDLCDLRDQLFLVDGVIEVLHSVTSTAIMVDTEYDVHRIELNPVEGTLTKTPISRRLCNEYGELINGVYDPYRKYL